MDNIYIDCETSSLDHKSELHCVVVIDLATGREVTFDSRKGFSGLGNILSQAKYIVGHNVLNFDYHVLRYHVAQWLELDKFVDTLILAQLHDPRRDNSLANLGLLVNEPKIEFNDFETFTQEMLDYCIQDCRAGVKVYKWLLKRLEEEGYSHECMANEHELQYILEQQRIDGLPVNLERLLFLEADLIARKSELDGKIEIAFPPTKKHEVFIPKRDNKTKGYEKGVPFIKEKLVPFNMNSNKQVIDKLWQYGWKPYNKTKGYKDLLKEIRGKKADLKQRKKLNEYKRYGWMVSGENLDTIPSSAPEEIKLIPEYKMINSRIGLVNNYLTNYDLNEQVIHGTCRSLGATTHRSSHKDPNLANVPGPGSPWGKEFRQVVQAIDGWNFVGTDADAIQLRILAHLMDDPEYINAVESGTKEEGTDIHTLNANILGCDRDTAKTFIYAWILNASIPKLASILGVSNDEATDRNEGFLDRVPSLRRVKEDYVPQQARLGYIKGFDGRKMKVSNDHYVLATYLQGNEKIIMARANINWQNELKLLVPGRYKQVAFVHDEWLTMVKEGDEELVADVQKKGLEEAGEQLNLRVKIQGQSMIGNTWYDVH